AQRAAPTPPHTPFNFVNYVTPPSQSAPNPHSAIQNPQRPTRSSLQVSLQFIPLFVGARHAVLTIRPERCLHRRVRQPPFRFPQKGGCADGTRARSLRASGTSLVTLHPA